MPIISALPYSSHYLYSTRHRAQDNSPMFPSASLLLLRKCPSPDRNLVHLLVHLWKWSWEFPPTSSLFFGMHGMKLPRIFFKKTKTKRDVDTVASYLNDDWAGHWFNLLNIFAFCPSYRNIHPGIPRYLFSFSLTNITTKVTTWGKRGTYEGDGWVDGGMGEWGNGGGK
ncbi:hypothetical protein B9Z19DRAFT_462234 [Tuber borchii]|uniref:Uncharacterized protein n=1 Tax=Tuber borchii TaxID=42251 RepID=A0A2T6ZFN7_TUBBO|nr:hypothetical protein B9Z19DRAFT_462234 [Tuber borchii]